VLKYFLTAIPNSTDVIVAEDVKFNSLDGVTIRGTLLAVRAPKAICLFLHGITVNRNEHLNFHKRLAARLSSIGVSSLLIDFRAHGKSGGRQIDFSPIGQTLDTVSSINFLRARYDLKDVPLTVVGTSFGAGPAIISARRLGSVIRQLFFVAPVLDYVRTFLEPRTEWAQASFSDKALKKVDEKGFLLLDDEFQIGARLVYEIGAINLTSEAKKISQPISIIHGARDSMVPVETSVEFVKNVPHANLIQILNMDHGFAVPGDEEGTKPESQKNFDLIGDHLSDYVQRSISAK
jgi:pimeloyl-ACP methyl ester carboxylesterase